ncbi:hypothetical protein LU306_21880 [Burkholderia gladioli]|nr:hypothetical protein [Burkholderia gladioli]
MDFAAVAEHQDIGDVFALYQFGVPSRQVGGSPAVIQGTLSSAIEPVSAAEVDAMHGVAMRDERLGQTTEKRGSRALQH